MWTMTFWKDAIERGVKTAAQVALGLLGGLAVTSGFEWDTFLISAGITVGLSFGTSMLSSLAGDKTNASLVGAVMLVVSSPWTVLVMAAGTLCAVTVLY